jgi:glycosidase
LEIPARSLDLLGDEKAKGWVNFIETHELPRLFSSSPEMTVEAYASLIKFIFTSPGVPLVMYGTETGLAVPHHIDHQGLFGIGGNPYNEPMMIWPGNRGWDEELHQVTRQMAQLRRQYPVLRDGETRFLYPKGANRANDLFMVREDSESPCILYAYSSAGGEFHFSLAEHDIEGIEGMQSDQDIMISEEEWTICLAPEESQVFILK